MILTLLLVAAAIGFLVWLLFTFAVFALPFFAGLTATGWAWSHGAGWLGSPVVGIAAGVAVLALGQLAIATLRSPVLRGGVMLLFALPAGLAGYHAVHGLTAIGGMSEAWRVGFSVIGAVLVAGAAAAQTMAVGPARPGPAGSTMVPTRPRIRSGVIANDA